MHSSQISESGVLGFAARFLQPKQSTAWISTNFVKNPSMCYTACVFNVFSATVAGEKGGRAKTPKKQQTARKNGKAGGRRPSRTLVERLLGKRIAPVQHKYIEKAYGDLLGREKQLLEDYFQTKYILDKEPLHTLSWRAKSRRVPKQIRYIIRKFKLAANHYLKDVPAPKSYIVETRLRSPEEQAAWEQLHPDVPCPPRKMRVDVTKMPDFSYFEFLYAKNPNLTAKTIMDAGGSRWTEERAEAALAWLKATHFPS
jgi:hypothetical protein